jgi:outer membrane protein OmpA-like peptidoglycan-associated protein
MRNFGQIAHACLLTLAFAVPAWAQTAMPPPSYPPVPPPTGNTAPAPAPYPPPTAQPPPPTSAPYPMPAPAPYPAPAPAPYPTPAPYALPPAQPNAAQADVNATVSPEFSASHISADSGRPQAAGQNPTAEDSRDYAFYRHNSLTGATGLLHTAAADSGAAGTFRLSILSSYYAGSGFLCPSVAACGTRPAGVTGSEDSARRVGANLTLSATVLPYLEAYAALKSHATSDDFGTPKLLQALGDLNLGVKGFLPRHADNLFSFGALGELNLLNSAGSVSIGTANVALRALGTLDLSNQSNPQQRIPLRFHANIGYLFDSSSSIVAHTESNRGHPITRIERFGLDINRVDSILIGVGAEYVHEVVQPFVEWTADVPSNRQQYVCRPSSASPGDGCLGNSGGFSVTPSRLTLGTRITPWLRGLNATAALDIGTGGHSTFVEEIAPQLPWNLYLGVGFAYDTMFLAAPQAQPAPQVLQLPPPPERHIVGVVLDEKTLQRVPNAIIRFEGRNLTGLVSRMDGSFETGNLEPGQYMLVITAEGYKDTACNAEVTAVAAATLETAQYPSNFDLSQYPPGTAAPAPAPAAPGSVAITSLQCLLKPAPAVGILQGMLVDAESGQAVAGAIVTARDSRDRSVELQTDETGNFRFENVPVGTVHLTIAATGFLPSTADTEVRQKGDQRATITLHKQPKKANVAVTAKEVKLKTQIQFVTNSASILPDSRALLQEIAAVLNQNPGIKRIEIQGHTDKTGSVAHNKRLSQERADAVRAALVDLGVDSARLTAVGYGPDRPLVPNDTESDRAKNRRVQLVILQRD